MKIPLTIKNIDGAELDTKHTGFDNSHQFTLQGNETGKVKRCYAIYKFNGLAHTSFEYGLIWNGEVKDWSSLATFCFDDSGEWHDILTVNHDNEGRINVNHQPAYGNVVNLPNIIERNKKTQIKFTFENSIFTMYLDGIKAGDLILHSLKKLYSVHFGLYCGPETQDLYIVNSDLTMEI